MKYPSEHSEQVNFVRWFRLAYPKVLIFAIPNGGHRHIAVADKLKAEGVVTGIPDLYIPAWRLWVEMKRQQGGKLSSSQKEMKKYLLEIGDNFILGHGFDDARAKIIEFVGSMD